jgi:uncharacterized membrane protein
MARREHTVIPLLGVVMGTVLLRVLGNRDGSRRSWRDALLPPLAFMYILTGLAHFTPMGEDLARFIPHAVLYPLFLVWLAGAIQIGAGAALLSRRWRTLGAVCLSVLLLVKLPFNWIGASQGLMVRGPWPTPPFLRVPLVLLWIAVLVWVDWDRQRPAGTAVDSTPSRS